MARKKWTEDYFRKRLKDERDERHWSQAEFAKMLSDKDIPMHWTTVAKIEKGERSVRIDEATAIADLFGMSLDRLLGRKAERDSELQYALRALQDTARQSLRDVSAIDGAFRDRFDDLSDHLADLGPKERKTLLSERKRLQEGLAETVEALASLTSFGIRETS